MTSAADNPYERRLQAGSEGQIIDVGAVIIMLPLQDVGDETVMLQVTDTTNLDEKME